MGGTVQRGPRRLLVGRKGNGENGRLVGEFGRKRGFWDPEKIDKFIQLQFHLFHRLMKIKTVKKNGKIKGGIGRDSGDNDRLSEWKMWTKMDD